MCVKHLCLTDMRTNATPMASLKNVHADRDGSGKVGRLITEKVIWNQSFETIDGSEETFGVSLFKGMLFYPGDQEDPPG